MTDTQMYLAIGIPILFNGICFTAVFMMLSWLKGDIRENKEELKDDIKELRKEKRII